MDGVSTDMAAYYRARAAEYDEVYAVEDRRGDLAQLGEWLADHVRGRSVLEVAAGTGYWTEIAAGTARSVLATDVSQEPLAIALARCQRPHVRFRVADAFDLPGMPEPPEVGMAHLWWSHVKRQDQSRFLRHLASRLQPASTLLMIDEIFVPGLSTPASRTDPDGNSWQTRMLRDRTLFQIVKNYPDADMLTRQLGEACSDISVLSLTHFWAVSAVFR